MADHCPVCDGALVIIGDDITNYKIECDFCSYSYSYINNEFRVIVNGQSYSWTSSDLTGQSKLVMQEVKRARAALHSV